MDKKKLKVVLEMLDNKSIKYPETVQYIENNMMEVSASENYQLKRYFFCCFCLLMMNAFVFDIIVWCLLVFHSKIVFLKKFFNDLWFTQKVVSTFLRFLLGRWTTFLSVGCFVLESRLNEILEFLWWSAKTWNMLI